MRPHWVSSAFLLVVLMYILDTSNAGVAENCDATYPVQACNIDHYTWHVLDDKRCMKATDLLLSFDEAKLRCKTIGADLVSVHNLEQNDRLMCYLFRISKGYRHRVWIGAMRGNHGFYWVDGSGGMTFSRWEYHQPDNYFFSEYCVQINYGDWGLWNDIHCSFKLFSVCVKNK